MLCMEGVELAVFAIILPRHGEGAAVFPQELSFYRLSVFSLPYSHFQLYIHLSIAVLVGLVGKSESRRKKRREEKKDKGGVVTRPLI